jgi:hypothetical protein
MSQDMITLACVFAARAPTAACGRNQWGGRVRVTDVGGRRLRGGLLARAAVAVV